MLLDGVRVVLVNTRFPENVGMAVRACANMGCSELTLVTPEMWIPEKAAPLATAKGAPLLSRVKVVSSLAEAVGDCQNGRLAQGPAESRRGCLRRGPFPFRRRARGHRVRQ